MLSSWLGSIYEGLNLTDSQIEATGRLGFHLCNGPDRWPHFFLDNDNLPEDMADAMRSVVQTSGPSLQISKMTPREIDLGKITEITEDTIDTLGRHALLRYAVLFVMVGGVLGYLFWLLRFDE